MGEGKGASLPSSRVCIKSFKCSRTSGDFPFPSFHLSVHSPQGTAVPSSNPALCIPVLGHGNYPPKGSGKTLLFAGNSATSISDLASELQTS